jgi:hypothetical protein
MAKPLAIATEVKQGLSATFLELKPGSGDLIFLGGIGTSRDPFVRSEARYRATETFGVFAYGQATRRSSEVGAGVQIRF